MQSTYAGKCPRCTGSIYYKRELWGDDTDGNRGIWREYAECELCDWQPGEPYAKQYDSETYNRWTLTLFNEEGAIESPWVDKEITEDMALDKAREHGYDSFEIAHSVETVRRYGVEVSV